MLKAQDFWRILKKATDIYQKEKDINASCKNPFQPNTLEYLLFQKAWIDNAQWDLEDIIRNPEIDPRKALILKRKIDKSNQDRTDTVEKIDDHFLEVFKNNKAAANARLNTESIAWALDRLSILNLKIHHMSLQMKRKNTTPEHSDKCEGKLSILRIQKEDLLLAIDQLMEDLASGKRVMKVYRQMKMYNDPSMNPHLSGKKES